ncbi:hypothetical protein VPH35_051319 [Triticum aestivum]
MDARPRDVLRRRRRVRHHGRRLRVRQPVRRGVRHADDGAEHRPLQQRRVLRGVLHDRVRHAQVADVQAGDLHHRHGHQLLPAQLRARRRQRRLVQPAAAALRHGPAGVGNHRCVQGRHRPRQLQEGALPAERRDQVHHQRAQLLRAGAGDQRGRQRWRGADVDQGLPHQLDGDEPELGRKLAEQRQARRAEPLVPRQIRRRPRRHGQRRRAARVVVRRHVHVRGSVVLTHPCAYPCCMKPNLYGIRVITAYRWPN